MSKKSASPAKAKEKPVEKVKAPSLEATAEAMATLLHNVIHMDVPQQVKRQELLADYRAVNPDFAPVRTMN